MDNLLQELKKKSTKIIHGCEDTIKGMTATQVAKISEALQKITELGGVYVFRPREDAAGIVFVTDKIKLVDREQVVQANMAINLCKRMSKDFNYRQIKTLVPFILAGGDDAQLVHGLFGYHPSHGCKLALLDFDEIGTPDGHTKTATKPTEPTQSTSGLRQLLPLWCSTFCTAS